MLDFFSALTQYQFFVVGKGWRNLAELAALSIFGPKEDAVCVNCEGRTRGPLCHQCAPGRLSAVVLSCAPGRLSAVVLSCTPGRVIGRGVVMYTW